MARDRELNIIVSLKNRASKELDGLTGSFIKASLAVTALEQAGSALSRTISEGMDLSAQYEQAQLSLQALSSSTQEYIRLQNLIQENQDGIFTDVQIANALKYAKAADVSVDTMEKLMPAIKNSAVLFGEDLQLGITAVTRAMKFGEAELAERIGLQLREYAVMEQAERLYGKRLSQLNQEQKEQVILQAVLDQTANRQGIINKMEDSAVLNRQRLTTATQTIAKALGDMLNPAMVDLIQTFVGTSIATEEFNKRVQQGAIYAYSFYQSLMILGEGAVMFGRAMTATFTSLFGLLDNGASVDRAVSQGITRIQDRIGKVDDFIVNMTRQTVPDLGNSFVDMSGGANSGLSETEKKLADMEDQLIELVLTHRETTASLKNQIADENEAFEESMTERKRQFSETMREMEDRHRKKVANIRSQLAEENADFAQDQEDRERDYREKMQDMNRSEEDRIKDLQKQLEKEEASWSRTQQQINTELEKERKKGAFILGFWNTHADQDRIDSLERRLKTESELHAERMQEIKNEIAEEKREYERKRQKVEEEYARETQRASEEHDKRLAKLQSSLEEEKSEHSDSVLKKTKEEERYTEKLRAEHEDRVAELQSKLDEELAIKRKHEDIFYKYRDEKRQDDITKLLQKMQEERSETQSNYDQLFNMAGDAGGSAGLAYGTKFNDEYYKQLEEMQKMTEDMFGDAGQVGLDSYLNSFTNLGSKSIDAVMSGNKRAIRALLSQYDLSHLGDKTLDTLYNNPDFLKKFLSTGGFGQVQNDFIMRPGSDPVKFSPNDTIVGFKGGMPTGGGTVNVGGITINNPVFQDEADMDMLLDKLEERLGRHSELVRLGSQR